MDNRKVLQGILFVLVTGIGWEDLPQELRSNRAPIGDDPWASASRTPVTAAVDGFSDEPPF